MPLPVPPPTHQDNDPGHTADHNQAYAALAHAVQDDGRTAAAGAATALSGNLVWADAAHGPVVVDPTGAQMRLRVLADGTIQAVPAGLAAPLQPTGLTAVAHAASVSLAWTAATSGGAASSWHIYRNGTIIATVPVAAGPTYLDATVTPGTTYVYTVAGVNIIGEGVLSATATATPSNSLNDPPVVSAVTVYPDPPPAGVTSLVTVAAQDPDAQQLTLALTATLGTLTPTADVSIWQWAAPGSAGGSVTFTATATDTVGATATANLTRTVAAAVGSTTTTSHIYPAGYTPGNVTNVDTGSQYEMGIRFLSTQAGQIAGVRFWREAGSTQTAYTGTLWSDTGSVLAQKTITGVTATGGWVDITFDTPVTITATTYYVASRSCTDGYYAFTALELHDGEYIAPGSPLIAEIDTDAHPNGRYVATPGNFPTSGSGTTYGVDVTFQVVTANLPPIDQHYYGRWPNSIPTAASFFPLGVFDQDASVNAAAYSALGINAFVGLYGWPPDTGQLAGAQAAGMICLGGGDDGGLGGGARYVLNHASTAPALASYLLGDEYDTTTPTSGPVVQGYANAVRHLDSTRPIYLGGGNGWAKGGAGSAVTLSDIQQQIASADILSADYYGLTYPNDAYPGIWTYGRCIDNVRAFSSDRKPVWGIVETTNPWTNGDGRIPSPQQVKNAVWMMLIHGARGIVYFDHRFYAPADYTSLVDGNYPAMTTGVTALNAQILSVAPALNSAVVTGAVTVASSNTTQPVPSVQPTGMAWGRGTGLPIDMLVKKQGGFTYIFAIAGQPGTTTATFNTTAAGLTSTTVTVVGESRTLTISGNTFSDGFNSGGGNDYEYHIYKIASS